MSKRNRRGDSAPPTHTVARREPDERMVDLLSEMDAARAAFSRTVNEYVHALKRWAAFVQVDAENSISLSEAFIAAHGLGDVTDRQLTTIMGRTGKMIDSTGPWNALAESCSAYYSAKILYDHAKGKAVAYYQYCQAQEGQEHDVPATVLSAIEAALEEHGEPRVLLNRSGGRQE